MFDSSALIAENNVRCQFRQGAVWQTKQDAHQLVYVCLVLNGRSVSTELSSVPRAAHLNAYSTWVASILPCQCFTSTSVGLDEKKITNYNASLFVYL